MYQENAKDAEKRNKKDNVYGKKGTERRDGLERVFESFKIDLLLRNARKEKNLSQKQLGVLMDKNGLTSHDLKTTRAI